MKKIISIVFVIMMVISLCSCSTKCSDEAKEAAEGAIMYTERYIDGINTSEEAEVAVHNIYDALYENLDKSSSTYAEDNKICDAIQVLYRTLYNEPHGHGLTTLVDTVEELKQRINYKEK